MNQCPTESIVEYESGYKRTREYKRLIFLLLFDSFYFCSILSIRLILSLCLILSVRLVVSIRLIVSLNWQHV